MKKKKDTEDIVIDIISYGFMALFALMTLLPFANIVAKAFSSEAAVVSGKVGIVPIGFQLDTMKYVLSDAQFLNSFSVSVLITVIGTVAGVAFTAASAYPLSKRHLPGMKFLTLIFVFTMIFNGGMIPTYLLVRNLHLINTVWAMILPGLIGIYNLLIVKSFYESLPESLEESARLDGASNLCILLKIVLPLSKSTLATITLFIAVTIWNDYMTSMLYITKASLKPLQLYLRDIVTEAANTATTIGGAGANTEELMNVPAEGVRAATIIAATVPILCVYPFLQKYFIKGVMIGSVKG